MAGPGGKPVGRVSIRAVPDGSRFAADLKKTLERIERNTVLNVPLQVDTRKAQLDLKKFQDKWNGETLSLDVDAQTLGATAHLKEFARRRTVDIAVQINKASLAKAASILGALSGGRLVGDLVKNVGDRLMNLDRALPKLAAVALGIATIGAVAISSAGGLFTVAAGLASIAGAGFAAPAIIAGMAVGVAALVVALKDAPKQLASLKTPIANLQNLISDSFWSKARKPIIDLTRSLLPGLRAGFRTTGTELGQWAASIAAGFQKNLGGPALGTLFKNLNDSITIAAGGTGAFTSALVTLGTVGGQYLPRLATAVSAITTQFDAFVQGAAADGSLTRWIDNGIVGLKQLGSIAGSIFSIVGGINSAAALAGGGGLKSLADVLGAVAGIVNSPEFQHTLMTLFVGAAQGVTGLATALGPIGSMFTTLAPLLAKILATSGLVVGQLLGGIADALANPSFTIGLDIFFQGIQDGLTALLPALPALAAGLGTVAGFAGSLAVQLGPVLGAAIQALAPVLAALLTALLPILPILGGALVTALTQLAPAFVTIVEAITPLLPPLIDLVVSYLPQLVTIIQLVAGALQFLSPFLTAVVSFISGLLQAFNGVYQFFSLLMSGANVVQLVSDSLSGKFGPLLQGIGGWAKDAAEVSRSAFSSIVQGVGGAINGVIDLINGAIGALNLLAGALKTVSGGTIDLKIGKLSHVAVPKLGDGGTVLPRSGGTLALLAERGRPESVVDTGRMNELIARITDDLAARSLGSAASRIGNQPVYVTQTVTVSPEQDPRIAGRQFGREFARTIAGSV